MSQPSNPETEPETANVGQGAGAQPPPRGESPEPQHSPTGDFDGGPESLRSVLSAVALVGFAEAAGAWSVAGQRVGISVGYGALLGFANLVLLGRMVRAFLARGGVSSPWAAVALVKLVVLCLALYLPVRARYIELLPLVLGFGALPVGIVLGQFLFVPHQRKAS